MTEKTKCKKPELSGLLPWLINGTLPPGEARLVEAHVGQCVLCQSKLEKMRWLSAQIEHCGQVLSSEHIWPEMLVDYLEAPSGLTRDDILFIETHLESCPSCRNEMEILKKVNESLPREPVRKSFLNRIQTGLTVLLSDHSLRPVWISIIILILLIPGYLGIFKWRPALQQTYKPEIISTVHELNPSDFRTETVTENEIAVHPGSDILSFSFHIPILDKDFIRYDAMIVDEYDNVIWRQKDIQSLDAYGTFLLLCNSRFFKDGHYLLKVSEFNISEARIQNETVFSLQIAGP